MRSSRSDAFPGPPSTLPLYYVINSLGASPRTVRMNGPPFAAYNKDTKRFLQEFCIADG